jgi:hypothetical protein
MYLERHIDASIHASFTLESDKPKTSGSAGVLVHHQCGINHSTKLGKVLSEFLVCGILADSTNENLARLLLLITRNSSLGVDLNAQVSKKQLQT